MCCNSAKWKREVVPDHKFDFVDVHEYHTTGPITRLRYALVYVFMIKSVLVYASDIYTAIAMLANNYWSGNILSESDNSSTIKVPFTIGKWIFTGCIIFSFLLLAWESRKARMIIRSRDISYAFTNVMANNYYTLKSYDHFCFFSQINNSKKKKDEFAFFVFFTFKGWKRLLLADAPRQVINGLTLYSFGKAFNFTTDLSKYYNDSSGHFSFVRAGVLCTMIFTVVIWCGSAILLAIAALMYVPLLCYIRGNLKEYCCHKIDKRIAELMKRKTKKRLAREAELAKREAAGDFRHLQDKKGRFKDGAQPLPQPTLPSISLEDDELSGKRKKRGVNHSRNNNSDGLGSGLGSGGGGMDGMYSYPPTSMPGMAPNYIGNDPHLYGDVGGAGNLYGDTKYAGYDDFQPPHFYNNFNEDGSLPPVDTLEYNGNGNHQPYRHGQDGRGEAYPYPSNESTVSFGHHGAGYADDKASIRSRDPLLYMGSAGGFGGMEEDHSQSQLSLNRAPSYKTREDDDGAGSTYDFGRAYQYSPGPQQHYPAQGVQGEFHGSSPSADLQQDYSDRQHSGLQQQQQNPFAYTKNQVHSHDRSHPSSQHASLDYSAQHKSETHAIRQADSTSSLSAQRQAGRSEHQPHGSQIQPVNFNEETSSSGVGAAGAAPNGANLRGVSMAGRSDITTFYYNDRDRASVADSHAGAFDLDDHARASMFSGSNANLQSQHHWQNQQQQSRGSRLDYLEEADEEQEEEVDQRHQQHRQSAQDWR